MRHRITEVLDLDLASSTWRCSRCDHEIGPAAEPYKHGLLIAERDPAEIWQPLIDEQYSFAYDRSWARVVEFYCPACATLFDVELIPPGHPLTDDIRVDVERLRQADESGDAAGQDR